MTQHKVSLARVIGPAFVAAVAYVDPGNVAANISAGAQYGYLLVWVLVLSNLMAMLIQYESAKLGIITGKSLPQLLGERLNKPARLVFWLQAEIIVIATDFAEVIGGAIALNLLFELPLLWGAVITGAVSIVILLVQGTSRHRAFEATIIGLLAIICIGFLAGLFLNPPDAAGVAAGLIPRFAGPETIVLAASMLGATVMPHAIYLHSSLVRDHFHGDNTRPEITQLLSHTRKDIFIALAIAGVVNIGLLLLAASSLFGVSGTNTIEGAHAAIVDNLGNAIGVLFAIGLLASGLASTSVGAYAGSEIMAGLLHMRIPVLARRIITVIPALIIIAAGVEPTRVLVISQALLSVGIPFAIIPLFRYAGSHQILGVYASRTWVRVLCWLIAAVIVTLNVALMVSAFKA